jgi:hypothetical protein
LGGGSVLRQFGISFFADKVALVAQKQCFQESPRYDTKGTQKQRRAQRDNDRNGRVGLVLHYDHYTRAVGIVMEIE